MDDIIDLEKRVESLKKRFRLGRPRGGSPEGYKRDLRLWNIMHNLEYRLENMPGQGEI